jgi:hypothetical protein
LAERKLTFDIRFAQRNVADRGTEAVELCSCVAAELSDAHRRDGKIGLIPFLEKRHQSGELRGCVGARSNLEDARVCCRGTIR